MLRLDPGYVPGWIFSTCVLAVTALTFIWANSLKLPEEKFSTELPEVAKSEHASSQNMKNEPSDIKEFPDLVLRQPVEPLSTGGIEIPPDVPDDMVKEIMAKLNGNPTVGEVDGLQLVGIERQNGKLLAVIFDTKNNEIHSLSEGQVIEGHKIKTIDSEGVTMISGGSGNDSSVIRINIQEDESGDNI